MMNHHELLGVPSDAEKEDITRAYRQLAIRYHPDKNPDDPEAIEKFKEVTEAFEALTKGGQKKTVDLSGEGWTVKRVVVKKGKPTSRPISFGRPRHPWWITFEGLFSSPTTVLIIVRLFFGSLGLFALATSYIVLDLPGILFPNMPSARLGVSFDGRVSVCKTDITDDELTNLKKFPKLEFLDLRGCANITDAGLLHLHGLTGLMEIELGGCPKITDAGVKKLWEALPGCRIVFPRLFISQKEKQETWKMPDR